MDRLTRIESLALPLLLDDIDTDVITPIRRILEGSESMIEYAFEAMRCHPDGSLDAASPLNDPRWREAEILLAGRNFGCGSSRETAVWAIKGRGVRCIIAVSFGDIFRSNCFKNGVLPVMLAREEISALGEQAVANDGPFVVDLRDCFVESPSGRRVSFEISSLRREALLEGLDDLALTLRRAPAIEAFEKVDRERRPWAYLARVPCNAISSPETR